MPFPKTSPIYQTLLEAAQTKRCVFFAGLPGTGKSLFVQQMVDIAAKADRPVHLLQWDVSRMAFETDAVITKYPEIDGVTDPAIRKGVGLWSRQGVLNWHRSHPDPAHILIGETPLVANRLVELAQKFDDGPEQLLSSDETLFIIPVPSRRVRAVIEEARAKTIEAPSHVKEIKDAPPNVLKLNWEQAYEAAVDLGMAEQRADPPYNPDVYRNIFLAALTHRHTHVIDADELVKPAGSVYELAAIEGELAATLDEVAEMMNRVETEYTRESLIQTVNNWHKPG